MSGLDKVWDTLGGGGQIGKKIIDFLPEGRISDPSSEKYFSLTHLTTNPLKGFLS